MLLIRREMGVVKTDSRIIQTKRAIKNEIISLLQKYPLNKITVKMLCDNAEINRATFYRYYEDVYDLYDKIKEEFIDEVVVFFHNANLLQTQDNIKSFLSEAKKHSDMIFALTKQNDAIEFTDTFCKKIYSGIEYKFRDFFKEFNAEQCKAAYTFIVAGCAGVLSSWITSGMDGDVDEISMLLNNLITKILKSV